MRTERLIGPASGDPADVPGWERPFRRTQVAGPDLSLVAGPVSLPASALNASSFPLAAGLRPNDDAALVWLDAGLTRYESPNGATDNVDNRVDLWGVPTHRVAGMFAPANGEFTTKTFPMPAGGLYINADAKWPGGDADARGLYCDERCQGYVMVAVLDANTKKAIAGYDEGRCVLKNVDGLRLPLTWAGAPPALAEGRVVALRVYFREATVFAVGAL